MRACTGMALDEAVRLAAVLLGKVGSGWASQAVVRCGEAGQGRAPIWLVTVWCGADPSLFGYVDRTLQAMEVCMDALWLILGFVVGWLISRNLT